MSSRGHYADESSGSERDASPDEEIARWAQAARAGEKGPPEVLPRPRPADPFDFRPKQEPSLPDAPAAGGLASLSARERKAAEPRTPGPVQPEMSVELVQDLIKKLADELNSTTAAERADKPITRRHDRGHDRALGRGLAGDRTHRAGPACRSARRRTW